MFAEKRAKLHSMLEAPARTLHGMRRFIILRRSSLIDAAGDQEEDALADVGDAVGDALEDDRAAAGSATARR